MKFGVRQIANVVFRAANKMKIGAKEFVKGQPVFYLDTAKTSSMESSATSVYATGGRGNTRLIAWEGEKTVTFTVEDALLSPISFSILSGAGILQGNYVTGKDDQNHSGVHIHQTTRTMITVQGTTATIDLNNVIGTSDFICETAPVYVLEIDKDGDLSGDMIPSSSNTSKWSVDESAKTLTLDNVSETLSGKTVLVDYYIVKSAIKVTEIQIDAQHFGGYFYVEADTLFRRQRDGKDLPAILTFPNVKIQSNFTFSMSASGDPSTFTFTMDAFPGYTYFNTNKEVICAIQIIDDAITASDAQQSVFQHPTGGNIDVSYNDSSNSSQSHDPTQEALQETQNEESQSE